MKVAQLSILAKVYGNVNADEVIGQRVTLKKMYSSNGEVLPFISARALKRAIRESLVARGYKIDPFTFEAKRVVDSGNPEEYVDNDIFGFMRAPRGEKGRVALKRQAPIAFSYFKALRDTPVKSEICLRAPRIESNPTEMEEKEKALLPFEIEVAEFIGRINCLIYDYIGKYTGTEKKGVTPGEEFISTNERRRRLRDFLEILLTPEYVLPRRSNSLNIPEYFASLVCVSSRPLPIYQYLDYTSEEGGVRVDNEKLRAFVSKIELRDGEEAWMIDYGNYVADGCPLKVKSVKDTIDNITLHLIP